VNQPWHDVIERAVDRNPVAAVLVRIGDPDIECHLNITPMQYQETVGSPVPGVSQGSRRWMVPARRLAAAGFPVPIRQGDLIRISSLGIEARINVVGPGIAGGDVVRWDITEEGLG
jgi:hypothetical protein